jgi:hypothetical protein
LVGGTVVALVGRQFELFFRLTGSQDARVLVDLVHPTAEITVAPCTVEGRFAVTLARSAPAVAGGTGSTVEVEAAWLERFSDEAVRRVFAHLAAHGTLTEPEAAALLGGTRALRRFSLHFEEHARNAPFTVRIDVIGGVKRYVKDGTER